MRARSGIWVYLMVVGWVVPAVAGVGEWKTYTDKRDLRDLIAVGTSLWAASSGGLFTYNSIDSSFEVFTTSDGLRTIDLTALAADATGAIWIGSANGMIQRYFPSSRTWQYVMDIALLTNPQKQINRMEVFGDTLFILSDVGVSIFSISRMEFGDSYMRFGTMPNQLVGNVTSMAFLGGDLWIGTRSGIARTAMGNPNRSSPDSWQVYTTIQGLPSNSVTALAVKYDSLIAGTASGLAVFAESTWNTVGGTFGNRIVDVSQNFAPCSDCQRLYFITSSDLWSYSDGLASLQLSTPNALSSILSDRFIGTTRGVMAVGSPGALLSPPGPPSNKFVGLAVDERGEVWSGTGSRFGEGFMSFDGSRWRSYSAQTHPELGINEYYKVSIGRGNTKWISSWGNGVALIDDGGSIRKVLNSSNGLPPTVDPAFIVVGGVAADRNGVTWITNRTAGDGTAVVLFYPDSALSYDVRMSMRNPLKVFSDIVIDHNDTKWFANYSRFEPERAVGLYYYNENINLPGTSNGWGLMTSDDGLTGNEVWSLAVDREGALWVGSREGISIIYNPGNPRATVAPYHPLRDQIIQAIVVDPLNNKWIATRQGVFVLSPDGTSILNRFTVENTNGKLLDNDVASMAMNVNTGVIYFGTEKGLSSTSTDAIVPLRSFEELAFYPNPYHLPAEDVLTIDGLVQGTLVKILTVDGKLVREIRTPGGRIGFWDGKDFRNELVGSGIYYIVAYSEDGTKVTTGKLAVVRK